jgi:hypothetical protein
VRLGLASFDGWAAALPFFLLLLEAAAEAEAFELAIVQCDDTLIVFIFYQIHTYMY